MYFCTSGHTVRLQGRSGPLTASNAVPYHVTEACSVTEVVCFHRCHSEAV